MQLTSSDLQKLSKISIDAAQKAGKYISSRANEQFDIRKKENIESLASQVVTEVDIQSEKIILDALSKSAQDYDLAILAEESTDNFSRLEKDYFWCIDPLDGTLPFTESVPGYSVCISLISKQGTPVIGTIYDPYHQNTYHAVKGIGAFINNKTLAPINTNNNFSFVYNRSFLKHKNFKKLITKLDQFANKHYDKSLKSISYGGAAMNAIWAINNTPSCFFAFPKPENGCGSFWDYAGTVCIYEELNLHVSDIYGNKLDLNRKDSTFMNRNGILYASDEQIAEFVISKYNELK